jgi:hypothetical protein
VSTHYEILGVPPAATGEEIRAAWVAKRKGFSQVGDWDNPCVRAVNAAYFTLKDEGTRLEYLRLLTFTMDPCKDCSAQGTVSTSLRFTVVTFATCPNCQGAGFFERK